MQWLETHCVHCLPLVESDVYFIDVVFSWYVFEETLNFNADLSSSCREAYDDNDHNKMHLDENQSIYSSLLLANDKYSIAYTVYSMS